MDLLGIHHLTAISADIHANHAFYTQVMGLRLVKRSVNQDDVTAYHLFYADAKGTPGTDITFFDWPMPRERRGTHSIVRTNFRIQGDATLRWWESWLAQKGVSSTRIEHLDSRATLTFEDPEGQRLGLVDDAGNGPQGETWERSPVPAEHQIRGLGPIMISVPVITETEAILTEVMNMQRARDYALDENARNHVHVFEMGEGGPHAELHVVAQPELPVARQGAGGVHHVAFRTPTEKQYHAWTERLNTYGVPNSGEIDRFWFRSLYFREPNGVLFEIATDGPGFGVDEDPNKLGEKVVLPPFLERHREQIVANLKPID
jgi:glyoxalase family protein